MGVSELSVAPTGWASPALQGLAGPHRIVRVKHSQAPPRPEPGPWPDEGRAAFTPRPAGTTEPGPSQQPLWTAEAPVDRGRVAPTSLLSPQPLTPNSQGKE
ncbi:hypothetical protein P7K49_004364 [Saguinus oedipus]|uniref:Uncharacterized protein n=1 Tax=Saguinus oedipus TaxID=9490 RepID=A0ABQ9W788_SAGOE|nr:hypothetical protein P7K49_004364 [Saguinus oedipus]